MKEKVEELKAQLEVVSKTIAELTTNGVNVVLAVETLKTAKTFICDEGVKIQISATIATEL